MPNSQAIVWIDNSQACVFRFGDDDVAQGRLRADAPYLALSHRTGAMPAWRRSTGRPMTLCSTRRASSRSPPDPPAA